MYKSKARFAKADPNQGELEKHRAMLHSQLQKRSSAKVGQDGLNLALEQLSIFDLDSALQLKRSAKCYEDRVHLQTVRFLCVHLVRVPRNKSQCRQRESRSRTMSNSILEVLLTVPPFTEYCKV